MLTLIGSLLGFLASGFPEIMKIVQRRMDNSHELKMYQLQIEVAKIQGDQKMGELVAEGDIQSIIGAHQPQQLVGIKWIDGLNATVRPFITYAFFLLYAAIKAVVLYHSSSTLTDTIWIYWSNEDQITFASIISFYFGRRAIDKVRA